MRSVDHEDEGGGPALETLCRLLSRKLFSVVEPLLPRGKRDEILEAFHEVTRREAVRYERRKRPDEGDRGRFDF
jgi:hypothetical protein